MGQLTIYKKRAPYYATIMQLVRDVLNCDTQYISEMAINSVIKTCQYLGIELKYDVYSKKMCIRDREYMVNKW